jgi:hypothetical protein
MFNHNWSYFEEWAKKDLQYVSSRASTGIYQCYCIYKNSREKPHSRHHKEWFIFKIISGDWFDPCKYYFYNFLGGSRISMTVGITIGILNNLTSLLIFKLISSVNFHSRSTQSSVIIITIFLMTYFNSGLFVTWLPIIKKVANNSAG